METKLNNGREYRNMTLETKEVDDGQMVVEGYATTFDQAYPLYRDGDDLISEQVDRNAFAETDMSDVIFQYDHAGRVFARKSNQTLMVEPDEHGLKITANLGGTEIGRALYEEIQGGYTNKMSFGFTVAKDRIEKVNGGYLRTILRIGKLFDVSAVSLPANDFTEISARNHIDGAIDEIKEEIRRQEEEKRIAEEKREMLLNRIKQLKGE